MVSPAGKIGHEALIAFDVWLCERCTSTKDAFPPWVFWLLIFGGPAIVLSCLVVNLYALTFHGLESNMDKLQHLGEWQIWRP